MNRSDAIPYVGYVVDDAGNGRLLGADPHAIVRNIIMQQAYYGGYKHTSVLVGWNTDDEPLFVAVHSYLDIELTDDEAVNLVLDYMRELGLTTREPDYLIR